MGEETRRAREREYGDLSPSWAARFPIFYALLLPIPDAERGGGRNKVGFPPWGTQDSEAIYKHLEYHPPPSHEALARAPRSFQGVHLPQALADVLGAPVGLHLFELPPVPEGDEIETWYYEWGDAIVTTHPYLGLWYHLPNSSGARSWLACEWGAAVAGGVEPDDTSECFDFDAEPRPAPRCDAPQAHERADWVDAVYWGTSEPPQANGLSAIEPVRVTLGIGQIFDLSPPPSGPRPFALFWSIIELSEPRQTRGGYGTHWPLKNRIKLTREHFCVTAA